MVAANRLDWQPQERRVVVLYEPPERNRWTLVWLLAAFVAGLMMGR